MLGDRQQSAWTNDAVQCGETLLRLGNLAEHGHQERHVEPRGRQPQRARVSLRVPDDLRQPGGFDLPPRLLEHLRLQIEKLEVPAWEASRHFDANYRELRLSTYTDI